MTQLSLSDALAAKAEGLERVEFNNPHFVPIMRQVAKWFSQRDGEVHIDTLRTYAEGCGLRPRHGNAWGAIFNERGWRRIGERPSAIPSNHGHRSPVWRWQPEKGD